MTVAPPAPSAADPHSTPPSMLRVMVGAGALADGALVWPTGSNAGRAPAAGAAMATTARAPAAVCERRRVDMLVSRSAGFAGISHWRRRCDGISVAVTFRGNVRIPGCMRMAEPSDSEL